MVEYSYVLAFTRDLSGFVMVHHARRRGWEMPGGGIKDGETPREAAAREFTEETGMSFEPMVEMYHPDGVGYIAAGFFRGEMAVERPGEIDGVGLFTFLPNDLSYPHEEYVGYIRWARERIGDGSPG